jgi:hypothetical protein
MPDSPLDASPYEVLGVAATVTTQELRRAYRHRMRETHPDHGGASSEFHAVQLAWEQVGTVEARTAYDARGFARVWVVEETEKVWAPPAPPIPKTSRPQARANGHPGGYNRERYLAEIRQWVGRFEPLENPYDPKLVRDAPREIRHLLADALAEEGTARELISLGMGFTIWHDVVATPPSGNRRVGKLDHIVLGPTGLWAIQSEDWGGPVAPKRGELVGEALGAERPVQALSLQARAFARQARVKFSALVIVVPDGASAVGVASIGTVKGIPALLIQQPRLAHAVRVGLPGVTTGGTDLFEVRTRVQSAVRYV